jgi:pimeloyl-ACP methyl ester carboxylesterase
VRNALSCFAALAVLLSGALSGSAPAQDARSGASIRALDPELTSYEYPFQVRFFEVATQDQTLRMAYMDVAQELRATPESIREYRRQSYFAGQWKPEYEPLIEILAGWTLHPEYRRVAWNAALTSDMVFTQPVLYEFEHVKAPTLLVIGQRDRTAIGKDRVSKEVASRLGDYPALGKAAAMRIPGARLVEIADAGHLPQVEAFPAYSRALLDFVR